MALGKILFISRRTGTDHIWLMNSDGSAVHRLNNSPYAEGYPSWSPDGLKICFEMQFNGSAVCTMNADGSNIQRLSPTPGYDVRPSYFPDGQRLIFTRVVGQPQPGLVPPTEIWAMQADGSGSVKILDSGGTFNIEPRISPDGSLIAFMSGRGGDQQIYTMHADGSNVVEITSGSANGDPFWSPDGSRLVFGSNREGGGRLNLFTMKPDGTDVHQVTHITPPYEAGDASWSPDGTQITFEIDNGGKGQSDPNVPASVWIINADGTGLHPTNQACSSVGCAPRWHP